MILHGGLFVLFCFCGLHRYIDPGGDTGGPGILLAQPAELLAHMVRALTVQKRDGTILYPVSYTHLTLPTKLEV